ncbi:hypothetical protein FEM08_13310 [Flavobacterium gilvum]|nr:hypothetical protein FEM08_13310 [Flavobacterium gilvum]
MVSSLKTNGLITGGFDIFFFSIYPGVLSPYEMTKIKWFGFLKN